MSNSKKNIHSWSRVGIGAGIITIIIIIAITAIWHGLVGKNEVQNFQIKQTLNGNIDIISKGGYYIKFFPTIWSYPKVRNVYFSRDKREGSPLDESIEVRFKNKGTGYVSTRVTYRLFGSKESIISLHENTSGDMEIADNIVLSKLKEVARIKGSELTSSEAVEKQESFINDIRKDVINNESLCKMGICVDKVEMTGIDFDPDTLKLFKSQQKAILLGKEAESKETQYKMQLKETEAKYKQQIAEERGKAEMQKMKAVTDAQREAELAKIDAEKKVTVAELDKKEAAVRQNKELELAEIDKKTALVKISQQKEVASVELEKARLDAESKIALAQAKQKEIELSGAITEKERVLAEIQANKEVAKAKAIAEGLKGVTLPKTIIIGNNEKGIGNLGQMWLMKQIETMENKTK